MVEKSGIALPLFVALDGAHALAHFQAVVFELDYLDGPVYEVQCHFFERCGEFMGFSFEAPEEAKDRVE